MRPSVRFFLPLIVAAGLAAISASPVFAQDIDFGDDAGEWDHDGQCDDPRFAGEGMASIVFDDDIMRDATDCRTLFEAGRIHIAGQAPAGQAAQGDAAAVADAGGIDFGDDASAWADDGVCDDPRFEGPGVSAILLDEDEMHDAADCRALFEAGEVSPVTDSAAAPAAKAPSPGTDVAGVDFGDDAGVWAVDGECDDPRFEGVGVSGAGSGDDIGHDASDCRAAFEAGEATLRVFDTGVELPVEDIDFGDDSGPFSQDDECDDPRFGGAGMAGSTDTDGLRTDATDCREGYVAGLIFLRQIAAVPDVDLGDDEGFWANDGDCDDPRFEGVGVSGAGSGDDIGHDASDCRAAFEAGEATLRVFDTGVELPVEDIDFGDDSGPFSQDDECDDPRFGGAGMAGSTDTDGLRTDATDCREGYVAGLIFLRQIAAMPDVEFGDDEGFWVNNGECDDPRFAGVGMALKVLPEDEMHDATDCRALLEVGRIGLRPAAGAGIDFGDNSGPFTQDGECDDPRFIGPGASGFTDEGSIGGDADDCREASAAGTVRLR